MSVWRLSYSYVVALPLKTARRVAQLTQEQLAERSGVDQSTISQLEAGRLQRVSYETVARLARALHVSTEELFPLEKESA